MLNPSGQPAAFVPLVVVFALCLVIPGCQTLEQIAPPVADSTGQLHHGRDIYVTRCVKCHAPEPVYKYTKTEWEEIIVDMADETNLTASETNAVRAYVMAVLGRSPGSSS